MNAPGTARAFLALWNGIASASRQREYETWHSFEHVPERVGLPGFIRARRYRALDPACGLPVDGAGDPALPPSYFTCYWLASREALSGAAYRDVFTHPTPWSARMRGVLTDFLRLPCDLLGDAGVSRGRYLLPLRLQHRQADADAVRHRLAETALPLVARAELLRGQWGPARPSEDFPIGNSGSAQGAGQENTVLLLEHLDAAALRQAGSQLAYAVAGLAQCPHLPRLYELLAEVHRDDLPAPVPSAHSPFARQPALTELMEAFAHPR